MLVRQIINDLKASGTTVFLNSHLLGEVEATCDRVSFIKDGRVLRTLSLSEFRQGALQVELRVDAVTPALLAALDDLVPEWRLVDGEAGARGRRLGDRDDERIGGRELSGPREAVAATENVAVATMTGDLGTTVELTVRDEEVLPLVAARTVEVGARLYALTPRRVSLEELFLDIVGKEDSGQ